MNSSINKYYAYHNIHEFVTDAMTNKETQEILQKFPSIWENFRSAIKNFIAKILGITTTDRSLFNDAVDSVLEFLKSKDDIDYGPDGTRIEKPFPGVENIPDTKLSIEQANL